MRFYIQKRQQIDKPMGNCSSQKRSKEQQKTNQVFKFQSSQSPLPPIFYSLSTKLQKNEPFIEKLDKIIMPNYNIEQKAQVYNLLKQWGNKNVLNENIDNLIEESSYVYYKEIDVLSARVYKRTIQIIQRLKQQSLQIDSRSQNIAVRSFLQNKNIHISYDRYLLIQKNRSQYQYYQRYDSNEEQKKQPKANANQQIVQIYLLIAECRIPQLKKLFQFLVAIGIFVLKLYRETDNLFIQRMERIGKRDQQKLYMESMQFECLEDIIKIQGQSQDSQEKQQKIRKSLQRSCINYHFYLKNITEGERSLHKLFQRYDTLEERHDYIQWMFPNHYQSAFNSQALPMNYLEKRLFFDEEIGLKMLVSIYIFFDFLGIRLDLNTFELSMINEGRFHSAIVTHTHNHLRLMRILACLSIIGFRQTALKLIDFLDKNTQKGKIGQRYRHQFQKSWEIYGDDYAGIPKAKAKAMCFLEEQIFPQPHSILKMFADIQIKQEYSIKVESVVPVQSTQIIDEVALNQKPHSSQKQQSGQQPKEQGLSIQLTLLTSPHKQTVVTPIAWF